MLFSKPTIYSASYNLLQSEGVNQQNVKFDVSKSIKIKCIAMSATIANTPCQLAINKDGKVEAYDGLQVDADTVDGGRGGWWGICENSVAQNELVTVIIQGKATVLNTGGSALTTGKFVKSIAPTTGLVGEGDVNGSNMDNHLAVVTKPDPSGGASAEIYIY